MKLDAPVNIIISLLFATLYTGWVVELARKYWHINDWWCVHYNIISSKAMLPNLDDPSEWTVGKLTEAAKNNDEMFQMRYKDEILKMCKM